MDQKAQVNSLVQGAHPSAPAALKAQGNRPQRDLALDFTKGILVLFMILYHWLNYFVTADGSFYRYLRFITPSFIFLAGFLVGNVYLAKCSNRDRSIAARLTQRGLKLLILFTILNIGSNWIAPRNYNGDALGLGMFFENLLSIYLIGNGEAAVFEVLVPIGYLLILCAPLAALTRWFDRIFHSACVVCFVAVFGLQSYGVSVPNLELIAIGLLGALVGQVPQESLKGMVIYTPQILCAYALYLMAISVWNVLYILQIAGVCLSLALIYLVGTNIRGQHPAQKRILLLGRYSLIAYILQIVVLQVLVRLFTPGESSVVWMLAPLGAVLVFTQITTEIINHWRSRSRALDSLYRFVFA